MDYKLSYLMGSASWKMTPLLNRRFALNLFIICYFIYEYTCLLPDSLKNPISGGRISGGYPADIRPPDGFSVTSQMEPVLVSLFKGDNAKILFQCRRGRGFWSFLHPWRHGKSIRRTPPEGGYPEIGFCPLVLRSDNKGAAAGFVRTRGNGVCSFG